MKVLIVDDMDDNREILEKLIKRFQVQHNVSFEIFEASDGAKAVTLAREVDMDLIFMDINMPVMNGLEATKLIKRFSPNSMIIVVSSEHDDDMQTNILQAGAEDYVHKPVNPSVMLSRLANYHKLLSSRNAIGFQTQAMNTFTKSVYSYHVRFFISNDDDLAQFWETLLMRFDYHNHINNLSDLVRFLYHLATYQLQKSYKCNVYLEEDAENFYFTMDNMKLLSVTLISKMIDKYCSFVKYEIKDDHLTFVLSRVESVNAHEVQDDTSADEVIDKVTVAEKTPKASLDTKPMPMQTVQALQTYDDLLDEETLSEFEHIVLKLKTEISMMGTSSLELDDIDTMHGYITELANILNTTTDTYSISESLKNFSLLLDEYGEEFLAKSQDVAQMVQAFINDIMMWKEMIFYTGAPSVDFLNNSISSNVEMIRAVFIDTGSEDEDLGDIFDF